jgi:hypothetical protein
MPPFEIEELEFGDAFDRVKIQWEDNAISHDNLQINRHPHETTGCRRVAIEFCKLVALSLLVNVVVPNRVAVFGEYFQPLQKGIPHLSFVFWLFGEEINEITTTRLSVSSII